jgi:hypothetical protein
MLKRFLWLRLNPPELLTPSVLLLIAANLVPLFGVLFLQWQIFPIMLVFWMENVIIGIINVFKMLFASPAKPAAWLAKVGAIPFFCFHYGLFTLVHGVFVIAFFGGDYLANFPDETALFQAVADLQLIWAFLALLFSHAISFAINYIGKGEYKQANLNELMSQPYTRVVILHITIILGAFLVGFLGSPVFALLVLIVLKTFIDIQAHLREHKKYVKKVAPDPQLSITGL